MTWLSDATTPRQLLDALAAQVAELEGRIEIERTLRQQALAQTTPPVCPNCGNNRQVWTNQLTGRMTCHRIWCQHLGEVKAAPTDTDRLRWLCQALEFDGLMDVEPDVHEYALEVADEKSHSEPTPEDYFETYRRLIDAAMVKGAA